MTPQTTPTAMDNRFDWVHGTTCYHKAGRVFIARDAEGFNLFTCAKPFGFGTLVGTFTTLAAAKAGATRYLSA